MLPPAPPGRGLTRAQQLRRRVGLALAGAGYVEVLSYPFVGAADFDRLGLPADDARRGTVRVANPLSEEEPLLTTTLLPGLLDDRCPQRRPRPGDLGALRDRAGVPPDARAAQGADPGRRPAPRRRRPRQAAGRACPRQPLTLGVVLAGDREAAGWWGAGRPAAWADAVQVVREVAARARASSVEVVQATRAPWHPGRCARAAASAASGSGTPASCTPPCARRTALPAAHLRRRARPRRS